ncbi:PREDICTED: regulatory solute carrier protein family 1 member 1, partial [Pterocles gutturalis]|uniref:regulatory solute carrier protein family 1 member 1 n=1 Tax=Pterocles gutturalis TaxID=240206 RepID=UPI0005290B2E
MPSLPASDGFQNPVQSSGLNSKICNPTNQLLDHSVSAPASVCSSKSSLAEPIDPRAVKSFESSTECQVTPEEEHPLQHLSNNASVANNDPSPQTGESKSISEIPANNELSNLAAEDSSSPSSIHQLDTDPGRPSEEPCPSLASALKELHKLLIISRKGECKISASEEVSQLEMVCKDPAAHQKRLSEDEQKGSDPASQERSCSFCEGPWLLGGCEEPPAAYTGLASGASPPAFPAADLDRILGAGFTTQEALEALRQADGNADLALLILLAKGIVVPSNYGR